MKLLWCCLLMLLPIFSASFRFPGPGEDPLIAVLDEAKLKIFNPKLGNQAPLIENITLIQDRGMAVSLDANYRDNVIYWGDVLSGKLYSLDINSGNQRVINTDYAFGSFSCVSYDWIHNNLYVCDWLAETIFVVNPQTGDRKAIINVPNARDLQVDPKTGWLYYLGGWEETAKIYKSSLNGENQLVLADFLRRARKLSLDYNEQRLYITNPPTDIVSIGVNGLSPTSVYSGGKVYDKMPKAITVTRDDVYWTQESQNSVLGRTKHYSEQIHRYVNLEDYSADYRSISRFRGMVTLDPQRQAASVNLCGENKGYCSHFCLPSTISQTPAYTCACPDDRVLMPDNKTCNP